MATETLTFDVITETTAFIMTVATKKIAAGMPEGQAIAEATTFVFRRMQEDRPELFAKLGAAITAAQTGA